MLQAPSRETAEERRYNPPARTQVRVPCSHRNSAHVAPPTHEYSSATVASCDLAPGRVVGPHGRGVGGSVILGPAPATPLDLLDPRHSLWGRRLILQGLPRSRPLPVRGATNELASSNNGAFIVPTSPPPFGGPCRHARPASWHGHGCAVDKVHNGACAPRHKGGPQAPLGGLAGRCCRGSEALVPTRG